MHRIKEQLKQQKEKAKQDCSTWHFLQQANPQKSLEQKMVKQKEREAVYALIPESEMLERHRQHLSRMHDVAISREFVNQALIQFDKLEKERTRQAHWDHYVNCDELPRPFDPAEVRTFLAKERHYEDIATDKSIDLALSVNERSILTQNIYRKDRTRRTLKQTLAINPAEYIERDVQLCLETLRKLDGLLDNDVELQRMNVKRLEDILLVRGDVEREIVSLFDRLAYRILGMQGAHMDSVDGRVASWSYKCQPWAMDIWGLLVAPVRFDQLEIPAMLAELRLTGVSVQMPLGVLKDCLTLRCIHTNFDSYSQHAKSYDTVVTESTTYPTAGIVDIQASAENEWHLQLDIQQEILDEMILKRQQYEELMELIEEKSQQAAKEAKAGNEKGAKTVVPKAPREPPMVPPGMVPDIYEEFTRREDSQYKGFLEEVYHPMTLNLTEDEINLRECLMLGGIYSIMFVGRPAQTQFEKFNIILHEDGRVLRSMPELVAVLKEPQDELRASALSAARGSRFRLTLENVKNMKLDEDELPYFNVVLQLAPELCLWGEPVVCQYLTSLEPMEHRTSVTSLARIATEKHKKAAPKRHTHEEDQEEDIPTANIFRPSMRSSIRYSKRTSALADKSAGLANFSLNRYFDHPQLWSLERHIMPRLLSSFKFPSEFIAELKEALERKKQTQKRGLIRRHSIEHEEQMELPNVDFDFESQHNPERLFPVFDLVESVAYRKGAAFKDSKTFYSLLDTIQGIKEKYLARQPIVEPGTKSVKKSEFIPEEPQPITRPPAKSKGHRHKSRAQHSRMSMGSSPQGASTTHEESMERMEPMREVQHWTTKHIAKTTFDRAKHTLTIMTDRLGVFGLAYKRYEHFPFGDWSLQPNEENPDEILLQLDTFHVRIYLYITAKGVRGFVTDLSKAYTAKPVKYVEIIEPVADFRDLRKIFVESNINIFAENDASFYIERDYFCIKHVAAEQHIYDVMALHCKLMKFYRSSWNPLAARRDIILGMKTAKDQSELSEVTVRITPERTSFVEVKELCSDDIDVIKLEFEETWRNISHCTDLHQAICSMNPHATEVRTKDPLLLYYVKRILSEIRLLSFS